MVSTQGSENFLTTVLEGVTAREVSELSTSVYSCHIYWYICHTPPALCLGTSVPRQKLRGRKFEQSCIRWVASSYPGGLGCKPDQMGYQYRQIFVIEYQLSMSAKIYPKL